MSRSTRSSSKGVKLEGTDGDFEATLRASLRAEKARVRALADAKESAENDAKAFQFTLNGCLLHLSPDGIDLKSMTVDAKPKDPIGKFMDIARVEMVRLYGDKCIIKDVPSSIWVDRRSIRCPPDCSLESLLISSGSVVRLVYGVKRDWFREGAPLIAPAPARN